MRTGTFQRKIFFALVSGMACSLLVFGAAAVFHNFHFEPPPDHHFIAKTVILEFPDDEVEWSFQIEDVCWNPKPILFGADRTFRSTGPTSPRISSPYRYFARLYARDQKEHERQSDLIDIQYEVASLGNLRDEIEVRYRVELTPTEIKLHKLDERTRWCWPLIGMWLVVLAVIVGPFGWLWYVNYTMSRPWKSVTRTGRPPGN